MDIIARHSATLGVISPRFINEFKIHSLRSKHRCKMFSMKLRVDVPAPISRVNVGKSRLIRLINVSKYMPVSIPT